MSRLFFSFSLFLLLILVPSESMAQGFTLIEGEGFIFYPPSTAIKKVVKGYDCFYSVSAVKDNKCQTGAKFRFMADAQGLTPFSEIEGHVFAILSSFVENETKRPDKQNYICFMVRDDGKRLLLRVPLVEKQYDNELTRGMSLWIGKEQYSVNVPACLVDPFLKIRKSFKGNQLLLNGHRPADNTLLAHTKYINENLPEDIYQHTTLYTCDSVAFFDVKGYTFQQPILFCHNGEKSYRFPIFDFRGYGECAYGSTFNISNYFIEKNQLFAETAANPEVYTPEINSYIGKDVWYQHSGGTSFGTRERLIAWNDVAQSEYQLASNKRYHCKGLDVCKFNDRYNSLLCMVFSDEEKNVFQIGLNALAAHNQQRTEKVFITDDEYRVLHADVIDQQNLRKTEERMKAEIQRKRDNLNKVHKGSTKDQVIELLGMPDYINTTTNAFTSLEQWVYEGSFYLYFSGNKLRSIEDLR